MDRYDDDNDDDSNDDDNGKVTATVTTAITQGHPRVVRARVAHAINSCTQSPQQRVIPANNECVSPRQRVMRRCFD